jgi:hypothetical protein
VKSLEEGAEKAELGGAFEEGDSRTIGFLAEVR